MRLVTFLLDALFRAVGRTELDDEIGRRTRFAEAMERGAK